MSHSKLSAIFILFIVTHLNLVMPVSKASHSSDICIMNNGIHMAQHSDNRVIHDHRGEAHHSGHQKDIHEIKVDCNMDMSSSGDIYFPGGEHPFVNVISQNLSLDFLNIENISFLQAHIREGFVTPPYNPPRFIS